MFGGKQKNGNVEWLRFLSIEPHTGKLIKKCVKRHASRGSRMARVSLDKVALKIFKIRGAMLICKCLFPCLQIGE